MSSFGTRFEEVIEDGIVQEVLDSGQDQTLLDFTTKTAKRSETAAVMEEVDQTGQVGVGVLEERKECGAEAEGLVEVMLDEEEGGMQLLGEVAASHVAVETVHRHRPGRQ